MLYLIIILVPFSLFLLYAVIPSRYFKFIYKKTRKKEGKTIYLTFDDGPSIYTEQLLDILKKYKIKASFFCVANFAKEHPSTIKRMTKEGHLIGLHSLNHENAYLMTPMKTQEDFLKSLEIMRNLNQCITYYRPPWGDINLSSLYYLKKNNLKMVLWHVMAEDWEPSSSSFEIEIKLLKRIEGNDIICLHDGRGENNAPLRTIEALDKVIPILLRKGYKFETVDKYYEN